MTKKTATVATCFICLSCAIFAENFASADAKFANDFGIGVGVGFPYRERAGYSKAENYAVLTIGKITEELTVTERSGRLKIEFKITNNGDENFSVEHRNSQEFDMAILDKNGKVLWQYSNDMAFAQALTAKNYPPHASEIYAVEIERKIYRKLKDDGVLISAYLTDTPHKISTRLPDIYAAASGSASGTIIIGGGKTW